MHKQCTNYRKMLLIEIEEDPAERVHFKPAGLNRDSDL